MSEIEHSDAPELVEIPIVWNVPDDVPSGYATRMAVQHTEHEFTVYFFELNRPIILGTPEERIQSAKEIKSVEAKCIAKITIAAARMPTFIDALKENLEHFEALFSDEADEDLEIGE